MCKVISNVLLIMFFYASVMAAGPKVYYNTLSGVDNVFAEQLPQNKLIKRFEIMCDVKNGEDKLYADMQLVTIDENVKDYVRGLTARVDANSVVFIPLIMVDLDKANNSVSVWREGYNKTPDYLRNNIFLGPDAAMGELIESGITVIMISPDLDGEYYTVSQCDEGLEFTKYKSDKLTDIKVTKRKIDIRNLSLKKEDYLQIELKTCELGSAK